MLNLSHCGLKSVPREFSSLGNLKILNLSHNQLHEVPECLQNHLKYVECLDLSYNFLRDFETEPACRVRLKVLLLNDNKLLNIPEWILYVRCVNLLEFDYSFNEINRLYASQFNVKSNYKLKKLILQSCYVFERDFKYINGIKTLESLDVSNAPNKTRFTNTINGAKLFEQPAFSETLQTLKLNYLSLSILSDNVVCFVNLRELYLICNNLSWLPDTLVSLSNLELLDISENTICFLPADFYKLCNLKKLIAYNNTISNLPDLTQMQQLHYIDLYKNLLTDFPYNIDHITHLDLEQNCFQTNESLPKTYIEKRNNLRAFAKFITRMDLPACRPSDAQSYSGSDLSSIDDDTMDGEEELVRIIDEEVMEECWDAPYVRDYVRVCTVSDDEWTGSEPPLVALRKRNSRDMMHREKMHVSPVFFDAD